MNTKQFSGKAIYQPAGISRSELPDNCVTKDYNIFNNK
jgi:hypothetical protein